MSSRSLLIRDFTCLDLHAPVNENIEASYFREKSSSLFMDTTFHRDKLTYLTRPNTRQSSRGWLGRSSNAKTARN